MDKKKLAIVGASGYTGGELIRLLLRHPEVELVSAVVRSDAGKYVHEVFPDLQGETNLKFSDQLDNNVDHVFLCLGHGESSVWLNQNSLPSSTSIVDLSDEFRYRGDEWVYGLPEIHEKKISKARQVANPGCFATAIQLGLLPTINQGCQPHEVNVQAITGSSGAGKSLSQSTHFTERVNNLSVYQAFRHRHLYEINKSLQIMSNGSIPAVNFVPMRGPFSRGIMANLTFKTDWTEADLKDLYKGFYNEAPFVRVVDTEVDLKSVINTNYCNIGVQVWQGMCLITTVIDNLIKGASGQAIQNFNLMHGYAQDTALRLKSTAY